MSVFFLLLTKELVSIWYVMLCTTVGKHLSFHKLNSTLRKLKDTL
jgi:hypothetical protein